MTNSPKPSRDRLFPFPTPVGIVAILGLILFFVFLLFPWDSLARRVAWEISAASGSHVSIETLAPALTARGPVLRARDVVIEHPAIDRVRLSELELAPRRPGQWLQGAPSLRIWTLSELGEIDGVLGLGEKPSFVGQVHQVILERLPLRLEASGVRFSGLLDGEADVALDSNGTLHGHMTFVSPSLVIESNALPIAIPFTHAEGTIVILENGATQIESLKLEGHLIEGSMSGEIGLVHRSQSPPIDLAVQMKIIDPTLQRLAPNAGFPVSPSGDIAVQLTGTLDSPIVNAAPKSPRKRRPTAAGL